MNGKEELEFIVALIQEYTEKMPQATKLAVVKHAQSCVDVIYKQLEQLHLVKNIPAPLPEETKPETTE
jgi:hypothetical protein